MNRLLATYHSWALTGARIALGVVMFPHGAQKMLGWFGGNGFTGTMGFFTSQGIPAPFAFLAIVAEFFGSLGLFVGLLGRVAAFGIFCNIVVANCAVHAPHGSFLYWLGRAGAQGGGGSLLEAW